MVMNRGEMVGITYHHGHNLVYASSSRVGPDFAIGKRIVSLTLPRSNYSL